MKREIKFRGKQVNRGEWFFGFYLDNSVGETFIQPSDKYMPIEVVPKTVGQLVEDSVSRKEIYEDDVVEGYRRDDAQRASPRRSAVTYLNGCFMAFNCNWHELFRIYQSDLKVIGNIHDNPELLKTGA